MPTYIHWFRRDLRLRDNPALQAALQASGGLVVPLFILDDAILRAPEIGAARVAFLLGSLRALDQALRAAGSRLIMRRGSRSMSCANWPSRAMPAACASIAIICRSRTRATAKSSKHWAGAALRCRAIKMR